MCVSLCASSAIVVSLAIPLPWRDDVQSLHISLNVMRSWLNLSPCSCSLRIWSRTFRASALVPFTMRTTRFCLPVMGSRPKQRATLHLPFMTSPFLLRAGVMLPSPLDARRQAQGRKLWRAASFRGRAQMRTYTLPLLPPNRYGRNETRKRVSHRNVATVAQGGEALSRPPRHAIAQFDTGFNFRSGGA